MPIFQISRIFLVNGVVCTTTLQVLGDLLITYSPALSSLPPLTQKNLPNQNLGAFSALVIVKTSKNYIVVTSKRI
jgi:hypothetical protein